MTAREQRGLVQLVREVARRQIAPRASHRAADQTLPAELFALLAELDLLGLPFAIEHGGRAQPLTTVCQVLAELSRAYLPVGLGAWAHLQATAVVANHATAELRGDVLPRLVTGEWLAAHALPAAEIAVDWTPALHSQRDTDAFIVDGLLSDVSHAGLADCYVVPCRPADVSAPPMVVLIAADTDGLSWEPPSARLTGTSPATGALRCHSVRVPLVHRLGTDGDDAVVDGAAAVAHLGVAACAVGLTRAALDVMHDVTSASRAPGLGSTGLNARPDADLAELLAAAEAADALCARAADAYDRGARDAGPGALARLAAVPTAVRAIDHGIAVASAGAANQTSTLARYRAEADLLTSVDGGTAAAQRAVAAWRADGSDGRWTGASV